ncbi:hypothetical protein MRBLMC3_003832 [Sphingobium sp. LMC3-1-1.1]|uniref:hypothetical protein n=1 Tax=Sphingobium sp. LMC3-1-1.1 TaxID=3135241 RepID=UPI0034124F82
MSISHRALDRLADLRWAGRKVSLHFTADYRIARFTLPLIKRLLADDEDGETYRCSISQWTINERPPLHIHRGVISTLRLDGPLQRAGKTYLPLGALIEAPHIIAHLNPVEANRLDGRVQHAIDRTLHDWIVEYGLYDQPRQPREIDRREADHEARAMIARWAAEHSPRLATEAVPEASGESGDCCSSESAGPCAMPAGTDRTMLDPAVFMARLQGCDAAHRASNSDTHLTHGCIQLFRRFSRVRSECVASADWRTVAIARLFASALRTRREAAL